ncbi:phosphonate C-P lyase system protein PhnH, partial [Spirillospora sp. NPDC029432]|uniref:phosphonate C-P lyase system protein PhnH n=1 Tax=Spirillospora sp. NPDC029432 TaxID=3154599 RepID=UPI0034540C3C
LRAGREARRQGRAGAEHLAERPGLRLPGRPVRVQAVDALDEGGGGDGVTLALSGPGVPGERRLTVRGLPAAYFRALADANAAFPAGIDTFLVAPDGTVAGLPRSVHLTIASTGQES